MPNTDDTIYELRDVKVKTLGLVKKGASGEDFFLLKSADAESTPIDKAAESPTPENTDESETTSTTTTTSTSTYGDTQSTTESTSTFTEKRKSVWKRIGDAIAKAFSDNYEDLDNEYAPGVTSAVALDPINVADATASLNLPEFDKSATATTAETITVTPDAADFVAAANQLQLEVAQVAPVAEDSSQPAPQDDISKENTMPESVNDSTVVDLEKSQLQTLVHDLEVRLQKAEADAAEERERREKESYFAKAATFGNLPISTGELADHMYWLAKTDAKRAAWFETVITAVDNQVSDAVTFGEIGKSSEDLEPADEILKAARSKDPKAALLATSPDAARRYLNEMHKRIAPKGVQ